MLLIHHSHHCLQELSGTFAGLMDLYERNYISLRRLIPQMPQSGSVLLSRASGGLDLHLEIVECFPYTTEVILTYQFSKQDQVLAEPNLHIRIYKDAQLAEVMSARLRNWPEFQVQSGTQLSARWHVNRFLYKWLNYCLYQGHRFTY